MSATEATGTSQASRGTVIITGANGSLSLAFVRSLLANYPGYAAILAVRDASDQDENTLQLRKTIADFRDSEVSIEAVDLASLESVRSFANSVIARVEKGSLPRISALICNAFTWSMVDQRTSDDGFELGFQVNHLSHFLLVLKLVGSMDKQSGRFVFLATEHLNPISGKTLMNPLGAELPSSLDELVTPKPDKKGAETTRGMQRYVWSKLANVMFMFMLNRKLQEVHAIRLRVDVCTNRRSLQNSELKNIVALAVDPGALPGSRALTRNTPRTLKVARLILANFVLPVAKYFTTAMRTLDAAGSNLSSLSVSPGGKGVRGYFIGQSAATPCAESRDEVKQEELWRACEKWVGLLPSETLVNSGL